MKYLYLLMLLFCIIPIIMQEFDDDDENSDIEEEGGSLLDFDNFIKKFGKDYGYGGKLDQIRERELKRVHGAVYLDYTGAGVYQESQVRKCNDLLLDFLLGNTHSVNPSSKKTEELVFNHLYPLTCRLNIFVRKFCPFSTLLQPSTV